MAATQAPPTIRFDESQLRRFSNSGLSGRSGRSGHSGEPGEDPEADSDEEHPQDWTVKTDEKDSWANRERRRSSIWAKTDHNTPFAAVDNEGRRGSVLSIWSAGKDKSGKHILKHNDEKYKDGGDDAEYAISDGLPSPSGSGSRKGSIAPAPNSPGLYPHSRKNTNDRKGSKGAADRRPSILGMWATGKDENGNVVMQHDDEEWNK